MPKKKKPEPRYECAHCGRKNTAPNMIHSRHTDARFCAYDREVCEARYRKRKKEAERTGVAGP